MELLLQVARICLPLFATIGFGVVLRRNGMLKDAALHFITRFVYLFSLPLLIFLGVAKQDFATLLNPAIIVSTLAMTAIIGLLALALTVKLPVSLRGATIASTFVGNVSYLGFPLAESTFGESGLTFAGIVNAFTMPTFVALALLCLTVGNPALVGGQTTPRQAVMQGVRRTLFNPVFLSAAFGVACSLILFETAFGHWLRTTPFTVEAYGLGHAVVEPIGKIGLTLALLAIGGSLSLTMPKGQLPLILACSTGKLIIAPLITLLLCDWWFPGAMGAARGTAVLLMACPVGVSLFVFSKELKANAEFVAGLLVVSTGASCVTLPLWVAWLLASAG